MPIPVLPEANRSVSDNRRFVPCSVTGIPVVDEAGPPAEYTCHGEHRPDWHEPAGIVATQLVTLSLQYVSDRGVVMFHCHIGGIIVTEVAGGDHEHVRKIQCQELLSQAPCVYFSQHQWYDAEVCERYLQEWQLHLDGVLQCVGLAGCEDRGALRQELRCIRHVDVSQWCPEHVCFRAVSYTHLRAHETRHDLVCRLLLEKKKR